MVTQKDIQDVVKAVNEVLREIDKRLCALEEAAKKPSSTPSVGRPRKKVEEK
jgi:hypothetical protein